MNIIFSIRRIAAALVLAVATAVVLPASGAQAQWYSSVERQPPPLYPYAVQRQYPVNINRPYAVEVAPGTYVIKRPGEVRTESRAERRKRHRRVKAKAPSRARRVFKNDPALIEELRKRPKVKRAVVNTTKIVHKKPIIRETTRYVDDPPRVIERYHVVDDSKPASRRKQRVAARDVPGKRNDKRTSNHAEKQGGPIGDGEKRVIAADAEITILGPDRMTIQLFRKGEGSKANARAD